MSRETKRSNDEHAIRKLIDDWMQATARGDLEKVLSLEGRANPVEIKVLGDWAYLRNRIDLTITPQGGQPMKRAGYTLTILKRQPDGRWVITRDANLMPPPG